jgi:RNA polymerase sigma-70 factor (ECF subfamily)
VVLTASDQAGPQGNEALETLCRTYWYPLYAYVRREGYRPHDAEDLIQGFFARFLERRYLDDVDRSKGRFRSFLLGCLKHFLSHEREKARALKRGGRYRFVPLDQDSAETRWLQEPADALSADRLFERRWAMTVLELVLERLRKSYAAGGKAKAFDALKETLTGSRRTIPYAELAPRLGMSEAAVKVAVYRLRQKYRELLRAEIANTVADPREVDAELRHLFAALAG